MKTLVTANINAISYTQTYTDAQKAEVWVKVAEAYLESDETDAADNFCSKVRSPSTSTPTSTSTRECCCFFSCSCLGSCFCCLLFAVCLHAIQ